MRLRTRDLFQTAHTEGGLLPADLLQRVADGDGTLGGLKPTDYHLAPGERLTEAVSRSWTRLTGAWSAFDEARAALTPGDAGGRLTRERWLHVLFDELGYGRLVQQPAIEIESKSFPVFTQWQHTPIHLVGCGVKIDARTAGVKGASGQSPHSLLQELLNRSPQRLWGIVSNGLVLRLLRDSVALTRQAFLEFDLEAMFTGEIYADFVLLWLVCHQSRVEAERSEECWLERWTRTASQDGTRALDSLRQGVQEAIEILGGGFLAHPANQELHAALHDGTLDPREYYRRLLRLVYRLLFLFVAEDRDALLDPEAAPLARERYQAHYSTRQLRALAARRRGGRQHDRYEQLKLVMTALDSDGCEPLALPALGSFLWSAEAIGSLAAAQLANDDLLGAVRALSTVDEGVRRSVDFRNLGAEELGSVYESLLELHPSLDRPTATFVLDETAGSERKTTGSYYTPTSLISSLLDSALEPVLDEAAVADDPQVALLSLAVVDPACGSGHFLIAAANRIAKRLAAVRSEDPEPSPDEIRVALRDVVGSCIHGVDMNPMAVELCKVSLWMEALEPGRPLSFLDHRIMFGNALLGATPELIAAGIPSDAFKPLLGDDKTVVAQLRKRNAKELGGQIALDVAAATADVDARALAGAIAAIAAVDDRSLDGVREQQRRFETLARSPELGRARLAADVWCAAFVANKKPGAEAITQDALVRSLGADGSLSDAELAVVEQARREYSFLHWHVAFPAVWGRGGFDVVLGNPPWGHTEIKDSEFFASSNPQIATTGSKAVRERLIAALEDDDPALWKSFQATKRKAGGLSHLLRDSGRFPLCGRGRTNTYSVFAELMRTLIGPTGRTGCIVQTGIATDDTTKLFFQDLVEARSLASLYDFENREGLFPSVDSRMKFCLLTLSGTGRPIRGGAHFVFFATRVEHLADPERNFTMTDADIRLLNPNTRTCPVFRTRRDAELTKTIYRRVPVLVREGDPDGDPWGFTPRRVFNLGDVDDLGCFVEVEGDTSHVHDPIPHYGMGQFHQFDHRFATYVDGQRVPTNHKELPAPTRPRAVAERREALSRTGSLWDRKWLLAWRDFCRSTDERTCIASVLPFAATDFGVRVALVRVWRDSASLLATMNSFVFDYTARVAIAGTHLSDYVIRQLPVHSPRTFALPAAWQRNVSVAEWLKPRVLELTYTAHDLTPFACDLGYGGPPYRWDEDRRPLIRAEIDAAMFCLYGIDRDDADYILDTFPIVRRHDDQRFGEYRTKRLILERYDAMVAADAAGDEYETPLDPPPGDPRAAHVPAVSAV